MKEIPKQNLESMLLASLYEIHIGDRIINALHLAGFTQVWQVVVAPDSALALIRGIGEVHIKEIRTCLKRLEWYGYNYVFCCELRGIFFKWCHGPLKIPQATKPGKIIALFGAKGDPELHASGNQFIARHLPELRGSLSKRIDVA